MSFFNRKRGEGPARSRQVNNMTIRQGERNWFVLSPDGKVLEEFRSESKAVEWATDTWDFLAPATVTGRINAAWRDLDMPKLENMQITKENSDSWYVTGWLNDERVDYSVEHASGKNSSRGIVFEQL